MKTSKYKSTSRYYTFTSDNMRSYKIFKKNYTVKLNNLIKSEQSIKQHEHANAR